LTLKSFSVRRAATALTVATGLLYGVVALAMVLIVNNAMHAQSLTEAEAKARIILDQNTSIEAYFVQELTPSVIDLSAAGLPADYFDPRWMSHRYAVGEIGALVDGLNSDAYHYREATVNARDPKNEANSAERDFLASVSTAGAGAGALRLSVVTVDGAPFLEIMKPGEVLEKSCLGCHGDPAAAPAGLVRQYGAERAFYRESDLGRVISVFSVRVPLQAAYAAADRFSLTLSGLLLAVLAVLFISQQVLSQRLIHAPLDRLRDKALQIAASKEHLGETMPVPAWQEMGELTSAFNTMSERLRASSDETEQRVRTRTSELVLANQQMEEMLERQLITEKALRESDQQYRLLFDQMVTGFALHDIICDKEGHPYDYRFLEVNPAFERMTGLRRGDVIGKTVRDQMPGIEPEWIADYGRVALTGEAISFERESAALGRGFEVTAFSPKRGQFAVTFMDITARQRAEAALLASERQMHLIADSLPVLVAKVDAQERYQYVNQAFVDWYRTPSEQVIGRTVRDVMGDASYQRVAPHIGRVLQGERVGYEWLAANGSGELRHLAVVTIPEIGADGPPKGYVLLVQDITEKQQVEDRLRTSLKEKEVLLKEVHHRVKNNLQVVSSLLNLQSRFTTDPVALQAFRESQNRISAMSMLHTKLCQSDDLSNIPFGDYVAGLCETLLRSFGAGDAVDLRVSAQGVALSMDTAVSCGLIVNELVSNALKYGLRTPDGGFGSPRGRPLVSIIGTEARGQIRIEISDNGVGLPEDLGLRQTHSLGLQLVKTLVDQLGGALEISGMNGACFVISFPAQRPVGE
jgi:PAS domain S-box-containing protein